MGTLKAFNGQLNQNVVLSTLFNMIIGQEVFSKNIKLKGTLVEKFRIDGTLYGDTKLFISTDIGTVYDFGDPASGTLLTKKHPLEPKTQAVTVDTFKQTGVTVDGIKLKQAFMSADIYGAFVAVTIQWLRDAYKVLNVTLINTFVGTTVTEAEQAEVTVDVPTKPTEGIVEMRNYESYVAELIGASIADVCVDLEDAMRDYNDYGHLRAYELTDFMIVWNKKQANRIRHISLPKIFHKDEVVGKELESITINSRYFGDLVAKAGTADGTTHRTVIDRVETVAGKEKQFFPGDLLPKGTAFGANEVYVQNDNIICKLVHKRAVPFMSALMIQTEFYNAKDLDRNHYLTWGYSTPTYLQEYPLITFVLKNATEETTGK